MLLFALSGKDAEELAVEMHPHTAASLRATGRGEALALALSGGERRVPEKVRVPHGGMLSGSMQRVCNFSRLRFGK